jgi:type VI secretion system protein ImpC
VRVEVTEIDDLIERWAPSLSLTMVDGAVIDVAFEALDDFHPDALFDRLPVFTAVRKLRKELQDSSTFGAAAEGIRKASHGSSESDGQTVERLLGAPSVGGGGVVSSGFDAFVRNLVAPYVVRARTPNQRAHLKALDEAAGELMRSILHHPRFQALEGAWRGLDFLLRQVEGGMDVFVWDMSKESLESVVSVDDPCSTHFGKRLIGDAGSSEPPWALVVGAHAFGPSERDARLIQRLSVVLAAAGVPFVSGVEPTLAAQEVPDPWLAWGEFRNKPEAAMVGLALPRFLLRLPYGKATDPIDRFAFEEQKASAQHDHYLWGDAGFMVACLLGRSFAKSGWSFSSNDALSFQGLPVHTVKVDGEVEQTPCAELWMGEQTAQAWLSLGLMPIASVRGRDEVRLLRVQSIADPPALLAGRWG